MNKKKNKNKNILKLILVFILFYTTPFLQNILIWLFNIKKITPTLGVLLSTFSNIVLLLILLFIYRIDLRNDFIKFKKNINKDMDTCFKYWSIGLFFMMLSNIIIGSIFKMGQAENEQLVQKMITSLPIIMLINAGFIGPIIEELIFRKAFKDVIKDKWKFIITSGLIFGLMHVIGSGNLSELLFIIPYGSLGIAFAYIYEETDSIFPSIIAHMLHNSILILISIIF